MARPKGVKRAEPKVEAKPDSKAEPKKKEEFIDTHTTSYWKGK